MFIISGKREQMKVLQPQLLQDCVGKRVRDQVLIIISSFIIK